MSAAQDISVAPEDRLRADLYDFLGALLAGPPDAALLQKAATLGGDGTELGLSLIHI